MSSDRSPRDVALVTTTHVPAADLGFLPHDPASVQSRPASVGAAHVRYPEASAEPHRKLTFWSRYSRMRIDETGRLTITSRKGVDLDVHISELQNLHQPRWMLMCGLSFGAAGKKWYVTFSEIRDIDWTALRVLTPRLGLALAEIQDLENQAMLSLVWMLLLEPTAPEPKTPAPGSVLPDGVDSSDGA